MNAVGKLGQSTKMVCYILEASVDPQAETPTQEGDTTVWPRAYKCAATPGPRAISLGISTRASVSDRPAPSAHALSSRRIDSKATVSTDAPVIGNRPALSYSR